MLCKICEEEVTEEEIGKTVSRLTERGRKSLCSSATEKGLSYSPSVGDLVHMHCRRLVLRKPTTNRSFFSITVSSPDWVQLQDMLSLLQKNTHYSCSKQKGTFPSTFCILHELHKSNEHNITVGIPNLVKGGYRHSAS